jgi:HlyD family secretion protein
LEQEDYNVKVTNEKEQKAKAKEKEDAEKKIKEYVFTIVDGKAELLEVKTGIQDNDYIEIVSGVADGQEVITAPYGAVARTLRKVTKVNVVEKDKLFGTEK